MRKPEQTPDEAYRTYKAMFADGHDPAALIDDEWKAVMLVLDDYRTILARRMSRMAHPVDPDAEVMVLIRDVIDLQAKLINGRKKDEADVLSVVHAGKQVTLLYPQCAFVPTAPTAPDEGIEPES